MKFFIVVAYCVLFFVALARADDDDGEDAAGHSASQFNGNNIGDISNVQSKNKKNPPRLGVSAIHHTLAQLLLQINSQV